jgi:SAM-dependent methyltransferase
VGADEKFDVVASQQGLQFFGDRAASAREMRRVLAPGGTLFVATWRSAEEMPPLLDLQRVAERHVGAIVDQRYSFGDERALERLLLDAGFRDVRVVTLALTTRFANGAEFVRMNAMALVGMSGAQLGDAERERLLASIVEESAEAVRSYTDGATLAFEMCTNVAVAR